LILRIRADGTQSYEPVVRYDSAQGRFFPVTIDLGSETDQVFLILFGTGIRHRLTLSGVRVNVGGPVGGVDLEVMYAGPQLQFEGVDQINVRMPRSLIGKGDANITLMVDGAILINQAYVVIK